MQVEDRLAAALADVHDDAVVVEARPARAYGLDEPRIAVGAAANLVLLDLNASYRIIEETFRSRSVNSWLLGATVKGKVRATIAAGRLAYTA